MADDKWGGGGFDGDYVDAAVLGEMRVVLKEKFGHAGDLAKFVVSDGFFRYPLLRPASGFDFDEDELIVVLENEVDFPKACTKVLGNKV